MVCGSTSASLITPDMSVAFQGPVSWFESRLCKDAKHKCSSGAEHFWGLLSSDIACRRRAGGGSRERRHGAALEPLAQRSDALGGVGALPDRVDAADHVVGETASEGRQKCSGGAKHFWGLQGV